MLRPLNLFIDRSSDVSMVFVLMASHTSQRPSCPSPQLVRPSDLRALFSRNIVPGVKRL